jgi:hypothetical protein
MIPRSAFFEIKKVQAQPKTPAPTVFVQSGVPRSILAAALAAGMVLAGSGRMLAQDVPPPPPDASQQDQQQQPQQGSPQDSQPLPQYGAPAPQDNSGNYPQQPQGNQQGQPQQQAQPLPADQLNQLVAPIALYPDALVAQILAAATYPTQVVEADRWRESQGNAPADQIANAANAQQWDPSVKALTAFPSVLSQMDRNLQWTTDLGNAYYNQPQDVMDAVQQMRQRAQQAGKLQSSPQLAVSDDGGDIAIAPANPEVVYVPAYNPWVVYGPPVVAWPGYYYAPPPGLFIGVGFGFGIGFGYGIPVRPWAPWGWGWHSWGVGWQNRAVVYNRTTYVTRSTTVINRGFVRPGGPPVQLAGQRGSFVNHSGYAGYANRVTQGARPGTNGFNNRPGNFNRPAIQQPGNVSNGYNRTQPGYNRSTQPTNGMVNGNRPTPGNTERPGYTPGSTYNRPSTGAQQYHPSAPQNYSRPAQTSRPAPAPRSAPAQHAAPAPHAEHSGGGGGDHHR